MKTNHKFNNRRMTDPVQVNGHHMYMSPRTSKEKKNVAEIALNHSKIYSVQLFGGFSHCKI